MGWKIWKNSVFYTQILFVSLLNGISTFVGYLMPKSSSQLWYYLTYSWRNKGGFISFPRSMSLKLSVIMWLEFELTYYDVAVQHFSHYAMGTTLQIWQVVWHKATKFDFAYLLEGFKIIFLFLMGKGRRWLLLREGFSCYKT